MRARCSWQPRCCRCRRRGAWHMRRVAGRVSRGARGELPHPGLRSPPCSALLPSLRLSLLFPSSRCHPATRFAFPLLFPRLQLYKRFCRITIFSSVLFAAQGSAPRCAGADTDDDGGDDGTAATRWRLRLGLTASSSSNKCKLTASFESLVHFWAALGRTLQREQGRHGQYAQHAKRGHGGSVSA